MSEYMTPEELKNIRKNVLKWSQQRFGNYMGKTKIHISRYENGWNEIPEDVALKAEFLRRIIDEPTAKV